MTDEITARPDAPAKLVPGRAALALFQPDRAHNLGTAMRLTACLDVTLHIIEPCGFPLNDRRIRQSGLDYVDRARWSRHSSFAAFDSERCEAGRRLLLLTTRSSRPYHEVSFRSDDVLIVGSERHGAPDWLHAAADLRLLVPMAAGLRSLNLVTAATLVLGEALRQTGALDRLATAGTNGGQHLEHEMGGRAGGAAE
jgi:tRNA (cytidine/uridine-2'-O-)-methyltransferase